MAGYHRGTKNEFDGALTCVSLKPASKTFCSLFFPAPLNHQEQQRKNLAIHLLVCECFEFLDCKES